MKKVISGVLLFLVMMTQFTFAAPLAVSVKINDTYLKTDVENVLIDGSVYVVARNVAEALGVEVTWASDTQEAHFVKDDIHLVFGPTSAKSVRIDTEIPIEGHTFIKEGRLFIPVRVFAEFLAATVSWQSDSYTVQIDHEDAFVPEHLIGEPIIDENELVWLARMVSVEARGGTEYKKLAVANVILNRVNSTDFPDSVYDVIMQDGQFPPAHWSSFPSIEPDPISISAASRALLGDNNVDSCLYFNLKPFSWKSSSDFYKNIEGDYFYY